MPKTRVRLPVAAFLALLPAAAHLAQPAFADNSDAALVHVDVYVTDAAGNRVTGLTPDAFEVFESRQPVAVSRFSEVSGGLRRLGAVGAPAGAEAGPMSENDRLRLVIYIDNFNLDPFTRNRVLRELRAFLHDTMDGEKRVMLVTRDQKLDVPVRWTSDAQIIRAALLDVEELAGHARQRESGRREVLQRIEDAYREGEFAQAWKEAREGADSLDENTVSSLGALREIVDGLAGLPGRKAVLYVSEGLLENPGEHLFSLVRDLFRADPRVHPQLVESLGKKVRALQRAANANRVHLYTIDARGDVTSAWIGSAEGHESPSFKQAEQIYVTNGWWGLQEMASATGGLAITRTNSFAGGLRLIAEDFDSYYSLAYAPTGPGDGRYHHIEVRVNDGRSSQVRHRKGSLNATAQQRMTDATRAAVRHDFQQNTLGLGLDVSSPAPHESGHYIVPIEVRIPMRGLALVPQGATHEARLELYVATGHADGGESEVSMVNVPISVPADQVELARESDYVYSLSVGMRSGLQRLVVGVRDEASATGSFVTESVSVGGS